MRHSTDRILVSHAGNLPRPDYLDELIDGGKATKGANTEEYHKLLPPAPCSTSSTARSSCGVDIVNDGEYAKAGSYGGYLQDRVTGFPTSRRPQQARRSAQARQSATVATSPASSPPASGSPAPAARCAPAL